MSSELMKYSTGEVMPPRVERPIARRAKRTYDDTRLGGFTADAQVALASHVMGKIVELDQRRRELAGDDAGLNALLADVELHTVRNLKKTMTQAHDDWKL